MSLEQQLDQLVEALKQNTAALLAAKATAPKAAPKAAKPDASTAPAATLASTPPSAPTTPPPASVSAPTAAATAPAGVASAPNLHPVPSHLQDAANALTALVNDPSRGGRPAGKALLKKFGVDKLTELSPTKISEFTAAAKVEGVKAASAPAAAPESDLLS